MVVSTTKIFVVRLKNEVNRKITPRKNDELEPCVNNTGINGQIGCPAAFAGALNFALLKIKDF